MKNYKTVGEFMHEYYALPKNKMTRFIDAQDRAAGNSTMFQRAIDEMAEGRKDSHWMWFIFPQLRGLAKSDTADFYGLDNLADAERFLENDQTGKELRMRIMQCFDVLLGLKTSDPVFVFGHTDAQKLCSCATLFSHTQTGVSDAKTVCGCAAQTLQKFFDGKEDANTLRLMNAVNLNELAARLRALIDPSDDSASGELARRFPTIRVPHAYLEPAEKNLFAPEEFYREKAKELCQNNGIGYFQR